MRRNSKGQFYNNSQLEKRLGEIRKCLTCGKEKYFQKSGLIKGRGNYCSLKCKYIGRQGIISKKRTGIYRNCLQCEKEIYVPVYRQNNKNFCSKKCFYQYTRKSWDELTYKGKHSRIKSDYGRANHCEKCNKQGEKWYAWSNKSGKYLEDISDWWQLCYECHNNYDEIAKKAWITKRKKI